MQQAHTEVFKVEEYLPFLDPHISEWFNSKYNALTEPQKKAIPLIHNRENVLVSSPTGSGKTLTGFLSVINELFGLSKKNELEDRIYCLYISPLKALANDINKNLNTPLKEIYDLSDEKGEKLPRIRAAVRSGDTPQNERQKMLRKPPHILITTPESFSLALSAPKFREKLQQLRWVIIDEIHEISSTKRGALLSANLERLASVNKDFIRVGLSATQAPLDLIGTYLCGYSGEEKRPFHIVEVDTKKYLDLKTITPVSDLTKTSYEVANDRMYEILADMVNQHQTTLIFTNTRSGTEHVAMRLKARGIESIEAHHSSLGKDTRLEVENKLKNGELRCVITSTSLELGIDIGYIDLVVQIGSPKSVSKGLQRIGRSGHNINDLSIGRFLVFDLDDLMECSVLTKAAYDREIDKVVVPTNSLDVLSQVIVGMSLERAWKVEEAYNVMRNSYTFHDLPFEDFMETINYLSGKVEDNVIYSKIWHDEEEGTFGKKKSTRMIYFMNIGTIPEEADYQVISEKGRHLGQLSDKFVERLKQGDIFVLGAKTYMYQRSVRNRVYVRDATGMRPTVPSWTGEMLPRSYDLGVLVGQFRKEALRRIEAGENIKEWLMENYRLDENGANSMISYIKTQAKFDLPTENHLVVEGYTDSSGLYSAIFHIPLGRRVNDALSRAYGQAMSNEFSTNTRITVTDDGFILTVQKKIPIKKIPELIDSHNFQETVARSITNTEVFKQRFRHCAARSLMVLRKYKGYDISVVRQQLRSDKLLKTLEDMKNFPVIKETYHEIMNDMMDVPRALKYVQEVIEPGEYNTFDYKAETSPFSYGLILAGVSDMVLMEDRSKLLKELQGRILDKIYGSQEVRFLIQDQSSVDQYFRSKVPVVEDLDSYEDLAHHFLFFDPFRNRFNSPFPYSQVGVSDLTHELIGSDAFVSAYVRGSVWTHIDTYPVVKKLFRIGEKLDHQTQALLDACDGKSFNELKKELEIEDDLLRETLNRLESWYLIRRRLKGNGTIYVQNDLYPEDIPLEDALEKAIKLVVGSYGPLTNDELSIRLPVDQDLLYSGLEKLVESGELVNDYITPVFAKQYILKTDLDALLGKGESNDLELRVMDFTATVDSVEQYFDKFGYAYSPESIRARYPGYTDGELQECLDSGKVEYGRFIKNKLSYAAKWLNQALYDLRYEPFKDEEKQFLEYISKGHDTEELLVERSGEQKKVVRQMVKALEFRASISKTPEGELRITNGTREPKDSVASINKLLSTYGPVSRRELERTFWAYMDNHLKGSGNSPKYLKNDLYYGTKEFSTTGEESAIVPVTDPLEIYLGKKYLSEIDYNSLFVSGGREEGSLNTKANDGVLWIWDLTGSISSPESFFKAVEKLAKGNQCRDIFIETLPEGMSDAATKAGFTERDGSFVYGDSQIVDIQEDDLFAYAVASSQKGGDSVVFEKLKEFNLGIRNEIEASYMGLRNALLRNYFQSKLLYNFSGPFGIQTMATKDTISLYRALRGRELTDGDQRVVHAIMEYGGATESEIITYLRKDVLGVRSTLKSLYEDCVIAKDSDRRYVFVPEKFKVEEAIEIIVQDLLDNLGFLDKRRYEDVTGRSMDEDFHLVIKALVKSGKAVKGIIPGVQRLLYINPKALKFKGKESRVLIPKDLILLYFQEYVKRQLGTTNLYVFVKKGAIVAGFSARKSLKTLKVSKIIGDRSYRDKMKREMNEFGYAVSFT